MLITIKIIQPKKKKKSGNYYQRRSNYASYPRQGRMGMNVGGSGGSGRMQLSGGVGRGRGRRMGNMTRREAPGTGAFLQSKGGFEDMVDLSKLKDDFDFGDATALFRQNEMEKIDMKQELKDDRIENSGQGLDKVIQEEADAEVEEQGLVEDTIVREASKVQDEEKNEDDKLAGVRVSDEKESLTGDKAGTGTEVEAEAEAEAGKDDSGLSGYLASLNLDIEPKYDKSKSFFDNLPQETRKDKKRERTKEQAQLDRDIDAATFGEIAKTYTAQQRFGSQRRYNYSRYNNRNSGYGNYNRNYNYNNNRQFDRRQRGSYLASGHDIRGFETKSRRNRRYQDGNENAKFDDTNAQSRWRV